MTDDINDPEILTTAIKALPVSESFCLRCKLMGFSRIKEIVETPPNVLLGKEDFNYVFLGELVTILKQHNLLHKLQAIPGSTFY
jgi:hypothetical protein